MNEEEVWRVIPGTTGYEASTEGRIRNPRGRVLVANPHPLGYRIVGVIFKDRPGCRSYTVHRLVALAFHGPRPIGEDGRPLDIGHRDHDKTNNRPDNIRYLTRSENIRESVAAGRWRTKSTSCLWHRMAVGETFDFTDRPMLTKTVRSECRRRSRKYQREFELTLTPEGRRIVRRVA